MTAMIPHWEFWYAMGLSLCGIVGVILGLVLGEHLRGKERERSRGDAASLLVALSVPEGRGRVGAPTGRRRGTMRRAKRAIRRGSRKEA